MTAEQRLRDSPYPPEVSDVLVHVFNETWGRIGHNFTHQADFDDARDRLARIILAYGSETPDADALKSTAMLVMQLNFPAIRLRE